MTALSETIKLTALAGTAFVSFLCCAVMLIHRFHPHSSQPSRSLSTPAAGMFFCSGFSWFASLLYVMHPKVFVYMHSILYLTMLYFEVLLYYVVFRITRTHAEERFARRHFIIPALLSGVMAIWSLFIPFDSQLTIIESFGKTYGEYKLYAWMATSKTLPFFLYNVVYSLLSLRKIRRYQQAIRDYSADEGHSPVKWLYLLFYCSLGTLPILLLGSFLGRNPLFYTLALVLPLLVTIFQTVTLCYNIVVVNFNLIEAEPPTPAGEHPAEKETAHRKLDKERFEEYIHQKQPYLNPDLRITEMAAELLTNRTYLSAFINREYGMNFSRYINHLRLKELNKLRANPAYAAYDGLELVQEAGFSSYRGYLRTKNEEDKETTVKMDRS